tara:strand:+ start:1332 stop:1697 length:366 start_codon:yes stop_codon:yes gene_type:complete
LIFDGIHDNPKQSMSCIARNNRISKATKATKLPLEAMLPWLPLPRSENTGKFPWKKSVTWALALVEVHEYEKPFRKGSYGELSQRLGKAVRVLGKPERVLGKPQRVPVKSEEKRDNSCICT